MYVLISCHHQSVIYFIQRWHPTVKQIISVTIDHDEAMCYRETDSGKEKQDLLASMHAIKGWFSVSLHHLPV